MTTEVKINEINEINDVNDLNWSENAPRGGRSVMNRVLKEDANVPLFFAQTLIESLRDVGYNNTTSALCEHIDNSIEAGATEIRVYFNQSGPKGRYKIDTAVYDNGPGMAPNILKVATAFGGSLSYGKRGGIGRFGMGMKTAALSMSPTMEIYSWQEKSAFYNMVLDVNEIGKDRANMVTLPNPEFMSKLPEDIAALFFKPMVYPKDRNDQDLFSYEDGLTEALGNSGTIIYMPNCDRLTHRTAQPLVDNAVKEIARVYRRFIAKNVTIYVNNRLVKPFDPTYSMLDARHAQVEDLPIKNSRLIVSKNIDVRMSEDNIETAPVNIKLYKLPIEQWSNLSAKVQKNDLKLFDWITFSILRNDREVFAGSIPDIRRRHGTSHWYRVQIDFPGMLDEAFGIATNKQGVRMKGYVIKQIKESIDDDIASVVSEIVHFQRENTSKEIASKPRQSEALANDTDSFQATILDDNLSPEERVQVEENLRGLAVTLKRQDETDEEAFERIKLSKYIITCKHDAYWPFYNVEHRFGKIILTINTAHPFYKELYEPIKDGSINAIEDQEHPESVKHEPLVVLELLLLSLARTQSIMSSNNDSYKEMFDIFQREWSNAYRIQLKSLSS